MDKQTKKTFGTMAGVFTPTTLTILGVIMFIRHSWVVGNAGVLGALAIVLLAVTITLTTALSLSSITTNMRIGSGGAFSVISKSLGLEIGGAIGIPFFFAQAIAVAMYIFGFREGVQMLLPNMNALVLDTAIFALVMTIAFISTSFAFKIQYVILAIIILSLVSIFGSLLVNDLNYDFEWMGSFSSSQNGDSQDTSFWIVFAVFFPAVTGVMAGANMSGDLTNPRRSIPLGTLSSVVLTTIIYLSLTFVAALIATPDELINNYNVFIEKSLYPPIVLAGLLGATLSSALGSFVGAPRILLALGEKNILPKSNFIAKISRRGEPIHAMLITAVIVIIGLSLRDLNTIAPLLTMFFMVTYAMVNVVLLIEQSLSLPSFRPSIKLPIIVPILGAAGSIAMMFVLNVAAAMFSIVFIMVFYFYLMRQKLKSDVDDSRSGLFTALAEWATKRTNELQSGREVRSWRPDLLFPVIKQKDVRSSFKLIHSIINPKGSIKILLLKNTDETEQLYLRTFVFSSVKKFKEINISASSTIVDNANFNQTINTSMQSLNAAFFKPNVLFISLDSTDFSSEEINALFNDARRNDYGMYLYIPFSTASLAIEKSVSLWLQDWPSNWKETFNTGNNSLSILTSILIAQNWKGSIKVNLLCKEEDYIKKEDLPEINEIVRFPKNTKLEIIEGELLENVIKERSADLNIISTGREMKVKQMIEIVNQSKISGLFCLDSSQVNAMV
jgi:amino acid transporter